MHTQDSVKLVEKIVAEVAEVAAAKGIELTYEEGIEYVQKISKSVEDHFPSMAVDVEKRRNTEIACLNEAVVAEGKKSGVSTPTLETAARLIRAIELNYENQVY